jgi:hypothetical protein
LEKPLFDFTRDFPHCNTCITKYEDNWERRYKMRLKDYLELDNEEAPVGGGVIPNYKPK